MTDEAVSEDDLCGESCDCATCRIIAMAEKAIPELKEAPADPDDLPHEIGLVLTVALTSLAESASATDEEALNFIAGMAKGMFHAYAQQNGKPLVIRVQADFIDDEDKLELAEPSQLSADEELQAVRAALNEAKASTIH